MEGLREYPRGLLRTIAYTQLCEAIEKDFGIELPRKTGKEIPKVIDEFIDTRVTDPLLEKMAEALEYIKNEIGSAQYNDADLYNTARGTLKEYRERKDATTSN